MGRMPQGRRRAFDFAVVVWIVAAAAFARLDEAVCFAADAGLSVKGRVITCV